VAKRPPSSAHGRGPADQALRQDHPSACCRTGDASISFSRLAASSLERGLRFPRSRRAGPPQASGGRDLSISRIASAPISAVSFATVSSCALSTRPPTTAGGPAAGQARLRTTSIRSTGCAEVLSVMSEQQADARRSDSGPDCATGGASSIWPCARAGRAERHFDRAFSQMMPVLMRLVLAAQALRNP